MADEPDYTKKPQNDGQEDSDVLARHLAELQENQDAVNERLAAQQGQPAPAKGLKPEDAYKSAKKMVEKDPEAARRAIREAQDNPEATQGLTQQEVDEGKKPQAPVHHAGEGTRGMATPGIPPEANQYVDNALDHVGGQAQNSMPDAGMQAKGQTAMNAPVERASRPKPTHQKPRVSVRARRQPRRRMRRQARGSKAAQARRKAQQAAEAQAAQAAAALTDSDAQQASAAETESAAKQTSEQESINRSRARARRESLENQSDATSVAIDDTQNQAATQQQETQDRVNENVEKDDEKRHEKRDKKLDKTFDVVATGTALAAMAGKRRKQQITNDKQLNKLSKLYADVLKNGVNQKNQQDLMDTFHVDNPKQIPDKKLALRGLQDQMKLVDRQVKINKYDRKQLHNLSNLYTQAHDTGNPDDLRDADKQMKRYLKSFKVRAGKQDQEAAGVENQLKPYWKQNHNHPTKQSQDMAVIGSAVLGGLYGMQKQAGRQREEAMNGLPKQDALRLGLAKQPTVMITKSDRQKAGQTDPEVKPTSFDGAPHPDVVEELAARDTKQVPSSDRELEQSGENAKKVNDVAMSKLVAQMSQMMVQMQKQQNLMMKQMQQMQDRLDGKQPTQNQSYQQKVEALRRSKEEAQREGMIPKETFTDRMRKNHEKFSRVDTQSLVWETAYRFGHKLASVGHSSANYIKSFFNGRHAGASDYRHHRGMGRVAAQTARGIRNEMSKSAQEQWQHGKQHAANVAHTFKNASLDTLDKGLDPQAKQALQATRAEYER